MCYVNSIIIIPKTSIHTYSKRNLPLLILLKDRDARLRDGLSRSLLPTVQVGHDALRDVDGVVEVGPSHEEPAHALERH